MRSIAKNSHSVILLYPGFDGFCFIGIEYERIDANEVLLWAFGNVAYDFLIGISSGLYFYCNSLISIGYYQVYCLLITDTDFDVGYESSF